MAFMPYSPLGGGLLGGKPGDNDRGRRAFLPQTAAIEAFQDFCKSIDRNPGDVALTWVAQQPGVTAPIVGPRTLAQFEASVRGRRDRDSTTRRSRV